MQFSEKAIAAPSSDINNAYQKCIFFSKQVLDKKDYNKIFGLDNLETLSITDMILIIKSPVMLRMVVTTLLEETGLRKIAVEAKPIIGFNCIVEPSHILTINF